MWLNGGPGASSLIGFFTENGPFSLNDDSINANGTVPTLFRNPYGWSSAASMLYIESPAGVGFSYCEKEEDCWFDDTKTAQDNYDFVAAFFDAYSEYKARDFYITGESCESFFAHPAVCRPLAQPTAYASSIVHTQTDAGIYIPTLVQQIDAHPEAGINLKGFAIGDGCIGTKETKVS